MKLIPRNCWKAFYIGCAVVAGGPAACAGDYIYVSNTSAGTVTQIAPDGSSSIFASGLSSPQGLAFDGFGNLYVANSGTGTISKINSSGNISTFASGLNGPTGLTFGTGGYLYVACPADGSILKIDSSGNATTFITGFQFGQSAYLASDVPGNVYANSWNQIQRFDPNGTESIAGDAIEIAMGMALDSAGNLYFAVQNSGFIVGSPGIGNLNIGIAGYPFPYNTDPPYLVLGDSPCDVAFDASGNLFATFSQLEYEYTLPSGGGPNGDFPVTVTGTTHGVLMEFGVNGVNTLVATNLDISWGCYLAVQSVPEPGIWAFAGCLAAAFCIGKRSCKCSEAWNPEE